MGSITFTARLRSPAKLDCPDRSLRAFWTERARLFCPSGSNLGAGTCKNSDSAREWHRNTHISLFQQMCAKTDACGPQIEAQAFPKLVKGLPSSSHGALKCSQMEPRAIKFQFFSVHIARLGPTISQGSFRHRIFTSKRFSRQSTPIKYVYWGTAECNKSVRTAKQNGPTFADIQHRPRLCGGLLRSASLDPPRYGNLHFV